MSKILFVTPVSGFFTLCLLSDCLIVDIDRKHHNLRSSIPGLVPYPEPYQTMYQQRRLGALGIEWRPPTIRFAVGPDFILGQEYQMLPLADLERMIEPLPEFSDAVFWEPENEIISEDNDSEYNVTEESEGERGSLSAGFSSDPECSAGDSDTQQVHRDSRRRAGRKKHRTEVHSLCA